jgi:purine nucleosidase
MSLSKIPVIVDADTANEVDDLYAIIGILTSPELDVRGLSAAQWQVSHWASRESMEDSQRLNELLLSYMGRLDIPHPRGSKVRLMDFGEIAQHSAAAHHIIREAHRMPEGEKLTVVGLGALTNIASAILIDPSINSKVRLFLLGTSYDFKRGVWGKRDFNCVMDIQAINEIFDAEGLETTILPVSIACSFNFGYEETVSAFPPKIPVLDYLLKRWYEHVDSGRASRTLWDLALTELIVRPELGKIKAVTSPPENTSRIINVYETIDAEALKASFFQRIQAYAWPL